MKFLLLFFTLFAVLQANSQTKKIAHRSHSGSNASFDAGSEDDFGLVRHGNHKEEIRDTTVRKKPVPAKDSIPEKKPAPPKFVKATVTPIRKAKVKA